MQEGAFTLQVLCSDEVSLERVVADPSKMKSSQKQGSIEMGAGDMTLTESNGAVCGLQDVGSARDTERGRGRGRGRGRVKFSNVAAGSRGKPMGGTPGEAISLQKANRVQKGIANMYDMF